MATRTRWAPVRERGARIDIAHLKRSINLCDAIELEEERWLTGYKCGRCPHPDHEDHNPSFVVYPTWFECKSVGAHATPFKGSVIDWYLHEHNSAPGSWGELLWSIAAHYGIDCSTVHFASPPQNHVKPLWVEQLPQKRIKPGGVRRVTGIERDWFKWRYQLAEETLEFEHIGYDPGKKSFVFLVWDSSHRTAITLRYRRFDKAFDNGAFRINDWDVPRYYGIGKRNAVYLYNRWRLKHPRGDTVRISLGELTALFIDRTVGTDAVSVTNGMGAFKPFFAAMIRNVYDRQVIVPDHGEMGAAVEIAAMFGPCAEIVQPLDIKGDVIDWVRDGEFTVSQYLDWEQSRRIPQDGIRRSGLCKNGAWEF